MNDIEKRIYKMLKKSEVILNAGKPKHNDIKMLSCPICNNSRWTNCGNGIHQCDICETYFDKDENILMTEQEYIQTCNTEQLAEFIAETINTNPCGYPLSCNECGLIDRCREDEHPSSKEAWVEWLKQPHKE